MSTIAAAITDLHNWIETLAQPYEKTGRATLSPKQKEATIAKLNAIITAANQMEAEAQRPAPLGSVRIVYREPDPDPEIQELKQQVNILKAQVEDRKTRVYHPIQSTHDFSFLFAILCKLATTPDRVAQLAYMMRLHKQNPSLTWDQLLEQSDAHRHNPPPRPGGRQS